MLCTVSNSFSHHTDLANNGSREGRQTSNGGGWVLCSSGLPVARSEYFNDLYREPINKF